jgi:hypothetical protein
MRREIPLLITAIVGLFMILSFFIPHPFVTGVAASLKQWFIVISAFAVVLGVGNLVRVNLHRIRRRDTDWGFKVVTLVGLFGYGILALVTDTGISVRPTWLTRSLHWVEPDRKELLAGRERLLDRREEVAAIVGAAPNQTTAVRELNARLGFDTDVVAPDLATLGPDGVRGLSPEGVYGKLEAAWKNPKATKRTTLALEGRLKVTGIRPLVIARLKQGADRRTLMEEFSLTFDQAEDMIALGPQGVADITREKLATETEAIKKEAGAESGNPSDWVFSYVFTPLQATMFSLLAFFIASAAFRAFRMRSLEAGLLLGAGLLVIFGRVPLGQFDWHIAHGQDFGFHTIMQWIMNVPNTAAMRGIKMGAAMGVVVMGLKVILGIERSYLGGD